MRFQINIYRPGKKAKKVPKPRGEERRISVAILIPLMFLLLLGITFVYMKTSSSFDRRMQMNRRQKIYLSRQLEQVERDLEKAAEERGLISKLQVKRIEWHQKLMDLSTIMPDDLWLSDLSVKTTEKRKKGSREVEEETYLTIKGVAVPVRGQEPLDSIARLISSLNNLDSFQRDFEPATLVYTHTHLSRGKERELMEFEISSKLKGKPKASGGKTSK